jgi:hypothetical protein
VNSKKAVYLAFKRGSGLAVTDIALTTVDRCKEMQVQGYELVKGDSKKYSDRTSQNLWLWQKREMEGNPVVDICLGFQEDTKDGLNPIDQVPADYTMLTKTYASSSAHSNAFLNQLGSTSGNVNPPKKLFLYYKLSTYLTLLHPASFRFG